MGKITRRSLLRGICIGSIVTLIWMAVIFWFSSQNATESSSVSRGLLLKIMKVIAPGWSKMTGDERWQYLLQVHTFFRKLAHFTEYAVLGMLLSLTLRRVEKFIEKSRQTRPKIWAFWLPALLALLYAISDELHQRFVDGRSCELRDICIDFAGGCLGILIASRICRLAARYLSEEKE